MFALARACSAEPATSPALAPSAIPEGFVLISLNELPRATKCTPQKWVRQRAGTTHGADSPNVAVANVVVNVRGQLPNGAAWPRARSSKVRQPGFEIVTSAICHVAERLVRSPGLGLLLLLRLRHRRCWERVRGGGTVVMQLVVGGTVIGILAILSDILRQAVFSILRILIVNKIRVWCMAVVVQLAFKSVGERVQILQ